MIKLPPATEVKLQFETTVGEFFFDGKLVDLRKIDEMTVERANEFLEKIVYKSRFYDARAIKDIVKIQVLEGIR